MKDPTAIQMRNKRWPKAQKARKDRHVLQFHAPYRQAVRWIKMNVKNGECFHHISSHPPVPH